MSNPPETPKHTSLFVGSTVSLALSLILPGLVAGSGTDGLAGAATAALTFGALYLLSLSLSFYLLGLTLFAWRRANRWQRFQGVTPFLLVMIVGLFFASQLQ